jgi:two-component system, chemotaxis family, protein-glutamate methylesterase/glutaminase
VSAAGRKRRIVICEDQRSFAVALAKFLEHDEQIEVVGSFPSAESMLPALSGLDPDLVTMDLEMPGMGGVAAIEEIMRTRPVPILVISSHAGKGSVRAAEALGAGALEAMAKSSLPLARTDDVWATAARSRIKRLATVRLRPAKLDSRGQTSDPDPRLDRSASVVGIGASTGGPPALLEVLRRLPGDFPLPLMIVQHMPAGFVAGLVAWLEREISLPVRIAADGADLEPGVWFGPGDADLVLDDSRRIKIDEDGDGLHRPSVDVLFASLARVAGKEAVGIVLTGMGRDGAQGAAAMRQAGGLVITQDEASSAVFGMPAAVAEGGPSAVLPLDEISAALMRLQAREPAR